MGALTRPAWKHERSARSTHRTSTAPPGRTPVSPPRSAAHQFVHTRPIRRFAHVVGARLEDHAAEGEVTFQQTVAEAGDDLVDQGPPLVDVRHVRIASLSRFTCRPTVIR